MKFKIASFFTIFSLILFFLTITLTRYSEACISNYGGLKDINTSNENHNSMNKKKRKSKKNVILSDNETTAENIEFLNNNNPNMYKKFSKQFLKKGLNNKNMKTIDSLFFGSNSSYKIMDVYENERANDLFQNCAIETSCSENQLLKECEENFLGEPVDLEITTNPKYIYKYKYGLIWFYFRLRNDITIPVSYLPSQINTPETDNLLCDVKCSIERVSNSSINNSIDTFLNSAFKDILKSSPKNLTSYKNGITDLFQKNGYIDQAVKNNLRNISDKVLFDIKVLSHLLRNIPPLKILKKSTWNATRLNIYKKFHHMYFMTAFKKCTKINKEKLENGKYKVSDKLYLCIYKANRDFVVDLNKIFKNQAVLSYQIEEFDKLSKKEKENYFQIKDYFRDENTTKKIKNLFPEPKNNKKEYEFIEIRDNFKLEVELKIKTLILPSNLKVDIHEKNNYKKNITLVNFCRSDDLVYIVEKKLEESEIILDQVPENNSYKKTDSYSIHFGALVLYFLFRN